MRWTTAVVLVRLVVVVAVASVSGPVVAQSLRVGTKESPPFAFRDPQGAWIGISIDLWSAVAERLGQDFELVEVARTDELLVGLEEGAFDTAISAITVTSAREERVDFTHPYFTTGLGVAVRGDSGTGFERIASAVFSWPFLTLVGSVVLGLMAMGAVFWSVEHRRNHAFPSGYREGVPQGVWWSTIMLLGHKGIFPATAIGRVLAASCMLVSILMLSVLTGAIASALTVGHFESWIRDENDLRHVRAFAVEGSSSAEYLRRQRIVFESVPSVTAGLDAVASGRGEAFVHDAPLLEYEVAQHHAGVVHVLARQFELQDYAVAVGQGSVLRERLNKVLLDVRSSPEWARIQYEYLQR